MWQTVFTDGTITLSEIQLLAPDPASYQRGQKVASQTSRTLGLGRGGTLIWGQFSGSAIYLTHVDLGRQGWRCSCPSRKQPCKHVLGLLILNALDPERLPEASVPEPVAEWARRRASAVKAKQTRSQNAKPVDTQAQDKRVAEREARVAQGLAHLKLWMGDLAGAGLGSLQGPAELELQAKRLVDAQAPGLSSWLLHVADAVGDGPDWPERVAWELGRLALLVQAYERQDQLPFELRQIVRVRVGWHPKQAEVRAHGERISGPCHVLGQLLSEQPHGTSRSTTLLCQSRLVYLVEFVPSAAGGRFDRTLPVGWTVDAELALFPASQRALILEERTDPTPMQAPPSGLGTLESLLQLRAERLAQDPWTRGVDVILEQVSVQREGQGFLLIDRTGAALPLMHLPWWRLLALSGGAPFTGLFSLRASLRPLGLWSGGRWLAVGPG